MGAAWPDFRVVSVHLHLDVMSPALATQLRLQQIEPPLSGDGSAVGWGGVRQGTTTPPQQAPCSFAHALGFAPEAAGRSQYLEAPEPAVRVSYY